jgi:hypothetical protein
LARGQFGKTGLIPKNYVRLEQELTSAAALNGLSNVSLTNGSPVSSKKQQSATTISSTSNGTGNGPDVAGQSWYFGCVPRSQCDSLLNEFAEDGDFLVRDSETNAGDFSVSLKAPGRNKHFRVHFEDNLYCIGQRRFSSMSELIEHYKKAPIYTGPKGDKLFLIKPFAKPSL